VRGPHHLSGDEVRAQGGSSLAKEKEYERRNAMNELQKAIESIKLHQEPGHLPSNTLVLATANKFGVEPDWRNGREAGKRR
jgi:hypothetical protein